MAWAFPRAEFNAGSSIPARIAMIAITTRSSIKVKESAPSPDLIPTFQKLLTIDFEKILSQASEMSEMSEWSELSVFLYVFARETPVVQVAFSGVANTPDDPVFIFIPGLLLSFDILIEPFFQGRIHRRSSAPCGGKVTVSGTFSPVNRERQNPLSRGGRVKLFSRSEKLRRA